MTRWTWRSLCFAAVVHLVMVAVLLFIQHQLERIVPTQQRLDFERDALTDVAAAADSPVPSPIPDIGQENDLVVAPTEAFEELNTQAGEPEFEQPPVKLNFAPLPPIAPPHPAPPRFDLRLPAKAAEGLGGGQPSPAPQPDPSGGGLFENRQGDSRTAALKRYGGNEQTENAVEMGLAFLARVQCLDGSWDPSGLTGERTFKDGGSAGEYMRGPVSALCVLPFLAAGHTPRQGRYKSTVKAAINRIMRLQTSDGCLAGLDYNQMYTHAVATLAMCEAYGMTQEGVYKRCAERAVRFIERTQSSKGGWTYMASASTLPNAGNPLRNDVSITGWVVLALKSAKAVGIPVSDRVWKGMADLLHTMSLPNGETYYADDAPYAWRKGIGMVGVGLTSRVILDRERFETANLAAQKLLLENKPDWERFSDPSYGSTRPNFNTFYGWYYSTLGMFLQTGGEGPAWTSWNDALKKQLLDNQVKKDRERGSWNPDDSWLGPMIGRLYSTACACLCLVVYYRYTPTFQDDDIVPVRPGPKAPAAMPDEKPGPKDPSPQRPVEIGGEILDLAKSADRAKYLRLLTKEKGLSAQPALVAALHDESATVRTTALNQLAFLKAQDACTEVLATLRRDENRELRSSIVYTLGQLGNKDAAPTLISLLADSESAVADMARRALTALAGGKDLGTNQQSWRAHFGV